MRIFSLALLCLISIISFVSSAPIVAHSSNSGVTDSVSLASGSNIQHVVNIVSTVTSELQPLIDQFSSATKSSRPNIDQINTIVSQMSGMISNNAAQLQTAVQPFVNVDGTGVTNEVLPVVEGLTTSLNNIVNVSNAILSNNLSDAFQNTKNMLTNIRNLIIPLVMFSEGSMATALAPLCGAIGNAIVEISGN